MTNHEIADHFDLLSKLMDIHGADSFRAKSYGVASFNIEKLPAEAATMDEATLFGQKGIGKSTGQKILELLATGKLSALEEILAQTPPGILDMLRIKGLGPKKIAVIWRELGIESVGELEYACNENRLVSLKGFGAKTQESVLQNISYFKQNQGFFLWAHAEQYAAEMLTLLHAKFPANTFMLTGPIRRQCETLEYIDMVTELAHAGLVAELALIEGAAVLEASDLTTEIALPGYPRFRFHHTTAAARFATLFVTTGSEEFTNAFRERFVIPEDPTSEEEIFTHNGLAFIPPMLREDESILDTLSNGLPNLIQPNDIRGIIHSHSTWSDGVNSIEDMAKAAIDAGLEYLVISDHSQTAVYAGGLKPESVAAQHAEIDALNARLAPFKIYKSIESDILGDGSLDYTPQVLATFDLVIASVHSNLKMSQERAMERLLAAIRNPYTTILGHPTGRLLLSRKGYPLDHKEIIDACALHNVVIEINAHPRRLDIDWRWIPYAIEKGVLLSIDPDAHSIAGFHDTYYGVKAAQKGGLTAHHNLSSYTRDQFEAFVQAAKKKR